MARNGKINRKAAALPIHCQRWLKDHPANSNFHSGLGKDPRKVKSLLEKRLETNLLSFCGCGAGDYGGGGHCHLIKMKLE